MRALHAVPSQGGSASTPGSVAHPAFKPEDADACLICGREVTANVHRKTRP